MKILDIMKTFSKGVLQGQNKRHQESVPKHLEDAVTMILQYFHEPAYKFLHMKMMGLQLQRHQFVGKTEN